MHNPYRITLESFLEPTAFVYSDATRHRSITALCRHVFTNAWWLMEPTLTLHWSNKLESVTKANGEWRDIPCLRNAAIQASKLIAVHTVKPFNRSAAR